MATTQKNVVETKDLTVEEKLRALYRLQKVLTSIDKIRVTRGELPLEVQDLEDEIAGLQTRILKCNNDIKNNNQEIAANKIKMHDAQEMIAKKEEASQNVANNREYDAILKEIEYQKLEIQYVEKKIQNATNEISAKTQDKEEAEIKLDERKIDLEHKKAELNEIIEETRTEEEKLIKEAKELESVIEERLLIAFKRIRKNARNGLAVVTVDRNACGGCFNKIPPQRQLDIKMRKKIIVCEYCGRILVDDAILNEEETKTEE
ncbi:MAG: C4-type zinc ribbon domain-containing protein [Paludibacteraceae bacterium]|nr:C4-type zinc ribbon domain-containing protein [Paludibacteraceae bacterium]